MADLVNALSPLSLDEDTSISLSALGTNLLADGLGDLREVTVSISTGFDSAADELTFTNPLPGGITAAYNDATGVLTLSGEASEADYEAALAGITYANTAGADAKEITVAITEFANNGDVVYFNGSFYELVQQQLSADAARAAAAGNTFAGESGFLLTITTEAEQNFINGIVENNGTIWLGGVKTDTFTGWAVGPEAGQPFDDFAFTGFIGDEPNDDGDSAVAMSDGTAFGFVPLGGWFDVGATSGAVEAYVVEYGGGAFTTSTSTSLTVGEATPIDPVDPVDPVDPTDPTDPTDPADPTDPTTPTTPTNSIIDVTSSDEEDGLVALIGLTTLSFVLTQNNTTAVSEIVVFEVEDSDGTVLDGNGNPINPNDAGFERSSYIQAILSSSSTEVVLSTLNSEDDLPNDFQGVTDLGVDLNFDENAKLGFLVVTDGSLSTTSATSENVLISTLGEAQIEIQDGENFTVKFAESATSTSFESLSISVTAAAQGTVLLDEAIEFAKVGRMVTIESTSVEAIDLRSSEFNFDFDGDGTADVITGQALNVEVSVYQEAAFDNLIGFYVVDAADGSINGITPDQRLAYAEAAFANRVGEISAPGNGGFSEETLAFTEGQLLLPFLIADGTTPNADYSNMYFTFLDANADGFDHFRLLGSGTFAVEDQFGGGDKDFDDMIIQIENVALA